MLVNTEFFSQILKLSSGWVVTKIEVLEKPEEIHLFIEYQGKEYVDIETGEISPIYDFRPERVWRHLDTMQYGTYLHSRIPRIKTAGDQIESVVVPWAEKDTRHTYLFEDKVIKIIQATHNQTQSGEIMKLSQEKVNYIMHKAVKRGLSRRNLQEENILHLSIDEKSYGKGHNYVTVLSNPKTGQVIDVSKGRYLSSVDEVLQKSLKTKTLENIQSFCCDMWDAYMSGLKKTVQMLNLYMIKFMLSNT
jgi:transposase